MTAKIPPKPTKDVIYIDVDDEITGIIDKVENSAHKVVALVLPKRAASLQSIVNMKLLKRSAETSDKNVVLITSEQALMPLAGAAGLHIARNLQSTPEIPDAPTAAAAAKSAAEPPAEAVPGDETEEEMPKKFDYSRPIGALAAKHEAENPETIDLDDEDEKPAAAAAEAAAAKKKPKKEGLKIPNFDRFRTMMGLGILALVALIVFIILALFVLPKATITITTSSEPVSTSFNLNASPGAKLDPAANTIPSKLESSDLTGTQSVTATGQQNKGNTATGSVTLTAKKCSGNPFVNPSDVPAGTGVSSGGQNYITQENTSFHGAGVDGSGCYVYDADSDTNITAQAAGSKYNVANASFSVTGRSDVTGTGTTSGGTDDIVTVLSQNDVDSAKDKLTSSSNADNFVKSFEDKLAGQDEYVLVNTMKAGNPQITSTPSVGQPASNATVNIKITYTVIALQKSDLSKIIEAKLSGQIDKTKQKLTGDFLNDTTINVASQDAKGNASLAVNVDTTAVPIINVSSVKKVAKGNKKGDIQSAIGNWAGVKNVDVKLSPFWVSKVPSKESKITVVIHEEKSTSGNKNSSAP